MNINKLTPHGTAGRQHRTAQRFGLSGITPFVALATLCFGVAGASAQDWVPYGSPATYVESANDSATVDSYWIDGEALYLSAEGSADATVSVTSGDASDRECFDISWDASWDWSGAPGTSPALIVMGIATVSGYVSASADVYGITGSATGGGEAGCSCEVNIGPDDSDDYGQCLAVAGDQPSFINGYDPNGDGDILWHSYSGSGYWDNFSFANFTITFNYATDIDAGRGYVEVYSDIYSWTDAWLDFADGASGTTAGANGTVEVLTDDASITVGLVAQ